MSNSGKSQKRRSSFWKHVGKAFGPDPLEIDLIPPRYSEDSFFSDGPKGGVVVSGQISITHYKPVSFGELKISFIGEALYQDDFSELQSVQIMNEQQTLLENATLEPQGSSNPHLLNFTFDISNEKSRNMEPSIRGKIRRCAASISYKLVVSVIDIAPLDRSIVKQLRLYYHHPHNYEGTRLWQGIKDFYGTVRYKIKLPQTGVAGSHFPVSCSCKPITDSTLMRWKDTGSASVNYGGTGDGRLKFQLRLVERMWILVGDGSSSTPRERRINLINEIGEETTGWLSKSQFTPRLPDWSAFTGTEADERVRRRSSISSTPSHGINLDEIDQSTLGLNPSGDFLEGRIHFSHALEIIMVFFDNRTIQHELPFRIVVENPFHTRRDDAFSIYSSPNQVYPSHDDEQAWMLSQEEAAQMSNSMTRAEREFYAHILEPVPPYEGPSEEYLLSQSIPDTVPEDEELNEFTKTPVLLQMSPAESPVFLSPPTNISGLPSPNEPTFGSVSMPEQPETSALDFQKIRLGKSPETNIVQEESPTSEKPPLLAQFFCTTSSSSTSTPSSSSNPRLMQRKQDKRPQTQIHQNANTIDENAESIGPRLPSNPLLRTRSDSLEARVKDSYKRRSAMDFIPHSESLKEVAGMRRGSLRADSGRLFDLSSVNGLNSGESEQTGTMTRKKGVVVRYRELAPPAEDGPSGSQAKTTVLPAEMMLPPSSFIAYEFLTSHSMHYPRRAHTKKQKTSLEKIHKKISRLVYDWDIDDVLEKKNSVGRDDITKFLSNANKSRTYVIHTPPIDFRKVQHHSRTFSLLYRLIERSPDLLHPHDPTINQTLHDIQSNLYPFLKTSLTEITDKSHGRGIVMAAGEWHFTIALHAILSLRHILNCNLPIEVYYNGPNDLSIVHRDTLLQIENVKVIDVTGLFDFKGSRLVGWGIKPFAILASSFEEVLFMDADVLFLQQPDTLFTSAKYRQTNALFFHDRLIDAGKSQQHIWVKSFLRNPSTAAQMSAFWKYKTSHEQDSGVIVVNKRRSITELLTVCLLNYGNVGRATYKNVHGDKETFWIGWEINLAPYAFMPGYGGAIGYPHEVKFGARVDDGTETGDGERMTGNNSTTSNNSKIGRYVCGGLYHTDEQGRPLWWNGGVLVNKYADQRKFLQFTHTAIQDPNNESLYLERARWEWETDETPFCFQPSQPEVEIRELEDSKKTLARNFVKLWMKVTHCVVVFLMSQQIDEANYDVPWAPVLKKAFINNYDKKSIAEFPIAIQLASVTNQGLPKIQPVTFYDFKDEDQRILIFTAATRNADLMAVVKYSQSHQLYWQLPKSKETFTFTGRMYIVAAPTMSHRFGTPPRRIALGMDKSISADDYWEELRLKAWKSLSPAYRATFTWPAPNEKMTPAVRESWSVYRNPIIKAPPPTIETGYSYTKLEAFEDHAKIITSPTLSRFTTNLSNKSSPLQRSFSVGTPLDSRLPTSVGMKSTLPTKLEKEEELRSIHNSALDNFSLLVFKCSNVEHFVPGNLIPARTTYSTDKNGFWTTEELTP